ncbi:hypothetical protein RD792_009478 [Penstemon davidsonii]|uniref:LOB domain-containing protein n=1 Tax=Penstemon davidsonii TaxID=160366 RepID=A0ABR0CZ52_9LAMI|nr:hypothetical protein RD792_009478 [Penstemon davidsonii]
MASGGSSSSSPCGACKFLRRKCAADCIFAPYFCSEQGPARFAAIHKVFGASNVSKLLLHVPLHDRCEAVVTIAYEAQARIRDPVYGCVSHIFALQQQVAYLQAQLMQVKAQMAQNLIDQPSRNYTASENQWPGLIMGAAGQFQDLPNNNYMNYSISPQSSLDSIDGINNNNCMQLGDTQSCCRDELCNTNYMMSCSSSSSKKRPPQTDLSELQALALRMIKE